MTDEAPGTQLDDTSQATSATPAPHTLRDADQTDFREHIPTADEHGKRLWIYPRQPSGRMYQFRTWLSYFLIALLVFGPFIRIGGNPLLMMNILERKFVIFGKIFWPQDSYLFALAMLLGFIMIVLFTAVFGRVWCGWLCPQTVLMELVFRKIEYWIEGDARDQRALNMAPWSRRKLGKKALKHIVFFAVSFVVGNLLLAYIVGSDDLIRIITDNPLNHVKGLTAMVLFSLLFYGIFARFREQACTFICPYGRFQSVLLDEHSIVVAYDHQRGERRGRFKRENSLDERRAAGLGDCVDCGWCVEVCPTGIDIRNGTQMECVNCTACIDACNGVMEKLKLPKGLIRYASENNILTGERLTITPRIIGYTTIILLLSALLAVLLAGRKDIETSILRAPGTLFQEQTNGDISNLYLVKIANKTAREMPIRLKLVEPAGTLTLAGANLHLPSEGMAESAAVVALPPSSVDSRKQTILIGVYRDDELIETVKTGFIGPETP